MIEKLEPLSEPKANDAETEWEARQRAGEVPFDKPLVPESPSWESEFDKEFPNMVRVTRANPFSGVVKNRDIKVFIKSLLQAQRERIAGEVEEAKPRDFLFCSLNNN